MHVGYFKRFDFTHISSCPCSSYADCNGSESIFPRISVFNPGTICSTVKPVLSDTLFQCKSVVEGMVSLKTGSFKLALTSLCKNCKGVVKDRCRSR